MEPARNRALAELAVRDTGLGNVAGINLHTRALGGRNNLIGALLTGLAGAITDQQSQPGVGLALQQLMHQLHAEKACGAGDKDGFFVLHSEINLKDRVTRKGCGRCFLGG